MQAQPVTIQVSDRVGQVSGLWAIPRDPGCLYVMAHGAGAGMHHSFMAAMAACLYERQIATLRYQFPYIEAGKRRPDYHKVLTSTVRAAVAEGRRLAPTLRLLAGGKSMGGRMTSRAQADGLLPDVKGLVFIGFPLHPAGKPGIERADHLAAVNVPMLFLQGTRDRLATLSLLEPVCESLNDRATLHIEDGADHGFHVLKRSGRRDDDVMASLATTIASWAAELV